MDYDFRDCADGSDEPGTAACTLIQQEQLFYCPNEKSTPRYIYASRVGDGICDCCDGSDEWKKGSCTNSCVEEGRVHQQAARLEMESMRKGLLSKAQALASVDPAARKKEAAALRATLPTFEQEVKERKLALDPLRESLESAEAAVLLWQQQQQQEQQQPNSPVSQDAVRTEGADGKPDGISEYAKWMEKEGTAEDVAPVSSGVNLVTVRRQEVQSIHVHSGDLVDFIEFRYRDGTSLKVGGGKGQEQEVFKLPSGEGVVEIEGQQGGLLDGIQFVTNTGRKSLFYGGKGGDAFHIKADAGMMIVSAERSSGTAGKITNFGQCPLVDTRSDEEKARDELKGMVKEAQEQHQTALQALQDKKAAIQELEEEKEVDSGEHAAYRLFSDCGKKTFGEFTYEICPFKSAKQGSTSLGTWKGWHTDKAHRGIFDDGARCHFGANRRMEVVFRCGEGIDIWSVSEPSQCSYEAVMTHPAACDETLLNSGEQRILKPRDEL